MFFAGGLLYPLVSIRSTVMKNQDYYITITGIDYYGGHEMFRPGMSVKLRKEHDNSYDDEAIAVYSRKNCRLGYVANSVHTAARGTFSAGRLYDKFEEELNARVLFVMHDAVIAETGQENGKG